MATILILNSTNMNGIFYNGKTKSLTINYMLSSTKHMCEHIYIHSCIRVCVCGGGISIIKLHCHVNIRSKILEIFIVEKVKSKNLEKINIDVKMHIPKYTETYQQDSSRCQQGESQRREDLCGNYVSIQAPETYKLNIQKRVKDTEQREMKGAHNFLIHNLSFSL